MTTTTETSETRPAEYVPRETFIRYEGHVYEVVSHAEYEKLMGIHTAHDDDDVVRLKTKVISPGRMVPAGQVQKWMRIMDWTPSMMRTV